MTQNEINLLYNYDKWADFKLFEMIVMLTKDQYEKDLGSSFGGIHGTIVHILSSNKVWLFRWTGKELIILKAGDFPTVEDIKKQWDVYHLEISNFIRNLTDEKLNEPLPYVDIKGNSYSHPLFQQMQHKVNHSSYHRGQVVTMLRQLGKKAINTDFINYLRQTETRG